MFSSEMQNFALFKINILFTFKFFLLFQQFLEIFQEYILCIVLS